MNNTEKINYFIDIFESIKKQSPLLNSEWGCKKMLCSTCGGWIWYTKMNLPEEIKNELKEFLPNISEEEYLSFGDWQYLLKYLLPEESKVFTDIIDGRKQNKEFDIINQEIDLVDKENIRNVENYIFYNRYNYEHYEAGTDYSWYSDTRKQYFREKFSLIDEKRKKDYQEKYLELLNIAISRAVETGNRSLLESLAIILKKRIFDYPELTKLCIDICGDRVVVSCLGASKRKLLRRLAEK